MLALKALIDTWKLVISTLGHKGQKAEEPAWSPLLPQPWSPMPDINSQVTFGKTLRYIN